MQLRQLRDALAIAVALNRTIIMPKVLFSFFNLMTAALILTPPLPPTTSLLANHPASPPSAADVLLR